MYTLPDNCKEIVMLFSQPSEMIVIFQVLTVRLNAACSGPFRLSCGDAECGK